jgi:aldose 1-epimerase
MANETAQLDPTGRQFAIGSGAARATVVEVGGGLRSFRVGDRDVLDGYDAGEMANSGRGQVLIPWPNRLEDGRYEWDGETQQLAINEFERTNAIHGLVRFDGWTCAHATDDRVEMAHTLWPRPGYPFTLELRVTYAIDVAGLTVTTTTRNAGTVPAPYGAGQHPYLLPPANVSVDDCELSVPATRYFETDDRGLPIADRPVKDTPFDFTTSRPIGPLQLDTAFTDFTRDADGRAHVTLTGRDESVMLWMDEGYPYVQVFTADTPPDDGRRKSIAIEPMTCPPNALATGTDVVRLDPGDRITTTWGLEVTR